jgi:hypothetical protein
MSRAGSVGKNARKKLVRKHLQHYSSAGGPPLKSDVGGEVPTTGQAIARLQRLYVEFYDAELSQRARRLDRRGCWAFLEEQLPKAINLGVEKELRRLVVRYAARFASHSACTLLSKK